MTIDEAIAQYQEKAEYFKTTTNVDYALELKQIAEWLEELKMYRESSYGELYDMVYNKAIDDFANFASTMPTVEQKDGTIRPMWLKEMAEQLKAGENNEISGR